MSCSFVGTEGLQKEFGHDRVSPPAPLYSCPAFLIFSRSRCPAHPKALGRVPPASPGASG